jgi:predicted permease
MLKTILSVLPLILLFATGFLLQKLSFFKQSTIIDLKKIVSNLALPALLFTAFVSLEFERKFLLVVVTMFVICLLMLLAGLGIRKLLKIESEYFPLLMAGFEMGMLGYALFLSIYGSENLSTFALVDLGQVLFVFLVLMGLLIQKKTGLRKKSELLKSFVSSPVIIAIIAGLAVSFLKQVIDPNIFFNSINEFLNITGSLTVPLIALVIGYELSIKKDGILLSLQTIIIRKVLLAVLAIVVNLLIIRNVLELPKIYEYAVFTMFMLPPPFVISIYMNQEDRANLNYVVNTLSLSTVVSALAIILVSIFY